MTFHIQMFDHYYKFQFQFICNTCKKCPTPKEVESCFFALGGALEKWPIFESLLITLRTRDMLVLVMVMVLMNFEAKKLSGRAPCSA
jgi:hypothetical protein